ncbi:MAG: acetyltransferase [Epsilonproteobacteria bacterium]|nr:acetyltransferase [Campylobacterota bacterium]
MKIYIYGASGHGSVVADIARLVGYRAIFIDDGDNIHPPFESIKFNIETPIALGVGDNRVREILFNRAVDAGFSVVPLIHKSAVIGSGVEIGAGAVVMANVVINSGATIGDGVILNSSSVIEHDTIVEDFVHISPNVTLAGGVRVGELTHIGVGSSIIQGISIGKSSIVGAGSVVVRDIPSYTISYGNPCRVVRSIDE